MLLHKCATSTWHDVLFIFGYLEGLGAFSVSFSSGVLLIEGQGLLPRPPPPPPRITGTSKGTWILFDLI